MPQTETLPGWASRPDEIIRAALLLSVLAHLATMVFLRLPITPIALEGRKVLTVILLPRQNASAPKAEPPPVPEPAVQEAPAAVTVRPEPPKAESPKPAPITSSRQEQHKTNAAPASEIQPMKQELRALPADPVDENQQIQTAGKAQAVLLVDENGTVGQIIWQQLPAVSEEELQEMERRLRQHAYMARGKQYTVPESIEVPRGQNKLPSTIAP
jgi:hypothetical protein